VVVDQEVGSTFNAERSLIHMQKMQSNLPPSTAQDARSQRTKQPSKIIENSRSSDLLPQKLLSNHTFLSPQSTTAKQNLTASKVLQGNHSYLRDFLKQHSKKSQKNFAVTERDKIG